MSNEKHTYRGGKDTYAIRYEHRDLAGKLISSGVTGGNAKWLDMKKWGSSNAIKRVKSAMGLLWGEKTSKISGDGDINRQFENGSTVHIWIMRDKTEDEGILDDLLK